MDGKIVFITGSTKGIGYAAAQEFLDLGAKVLVNGRDADACREACQKMSDEAVTRWLGTSRRRKEETRW
jgi:NAD(P)-dependent dehydrogenase (short-subunit alcohol dehydrogenase family)